MQEIRGLCQIDEDGNMLPDAAHTLNIVGKVRARARPRDAVRSVLS